jgi:hypothetical protein
MHEPTCLFWASLTPFSLHETLKAGQLSSIGSAMQEGDPPKAAKSFSRPLVCFTRIVTNKHQVTRARQSSILARTTLKNLTEWSHGTVRPGMRDIIFDLSPYSNTY